MLGFKQSISNQTLLLLRPGTGGPHGVGVNPALSVLGNKAAWQLVAPGQTASHWNESRSGHPAALCCTSLTVDK